VGTSATPKQKQMSNLTGRVPATNPRKNKMNIDGFLKNLASQTSSTETLRAYRQDLEKYQEFLRLKGLRVTQAKSRTISEFVNHLNDKNGGPLAPASVSRRLSVVSAFYEFLPDNSDGEVRNPVARVKRPKINNELPRAVEDNVLATLVDGITDVRDRAIVLLFVYSGLRLSELCQLNKDTIVPRRRTAPDGTVQFFGQGEVIGKGRRRRQFMVGPTALQALGEYIKAHRTKDEIPALFLSERRQRISSRSVQDIVDRWCKRLNVPHIHVHQLRHSFATRNVNAGMSAAVLQELLGHSQLSTSQRYFRVKPDRLAREYFSVMEFVRQTSPVYSAVTIGSGGRTFKSLRPNPNDGGGNEKTQGLRRKKLRSFGKSQAPVINGNVAQQIQPAVGDIMSTIYTVMTDKVKNSAVATDSIRVSPRHLGQMPGHASVHVASGTRLPWASATHSTCPCQASCSTWIVSRRFWWRHNSRLRASAPSGSPAWVALGRSTSRRR
jgi:site-specific recombinase XerD